MGLVFYHHVNGLNEKCTRSCVCVNLMSVCHAREMTHLCGLPFPTSTAPMGGFCWQTQAFFRAMPGPRNWDVSPAVVDGFHLPTPGGRAHGCLSFENFPGFFKELMIHVRASVDFIVGIRVRGRESGEVWAAPSPPVTTWGLWTIVCSQALLHPSIIHSSQVPC